MIFLDTDIISYYFDANAKVKEKLLVVLPETLIYNPFDKIEKAKSPDWGKLRLSKI